MSNEMNNNDLLVTLTGDNAATATTEQAKGTMVKPEQAPPAAGESVTDDETDTESVGSDDGYYISDDSFGSFYHPPKELVKQYLNGLMKDQEAEAAAAAARTAQPDAEEELEGGYISDDTLGSFDFDQPEKPKANNKQEEIIDEGYISDDSLGAFDHLTIDKVVDVQAKPEAEN